PAGPPPERSWRHPPRSGRSRIASSPFPPGPIVPERRRTVLKAAPGQDGRRLKFHDPLYRSVYSAVGGPANAQLRAPWGTRKERQVLTPNRLKRIGRRQNRNAPVGRGQRRPTA